MNSSPDEKETSVLCIPMVNAPNKNLDGLLVSVLNRCVSDIVQCVDLAVFSHLHYLILHYYPSLVNLSKTSSIKLGRTLPSEPTSQIVIILIVVLVTRATHFFAIRSNQLLYVWNLIVLTRGLHVLVEMVINIKFLVYRWRLLALANNEPSGLPNWVDWWNQKSQRIRCC